MLNNDTKTLQFNLQCKKIVVFQHCYVEKKNYWYTPIKPPLAIVENKWRH